MRTSGLSATMHGVPRRCKLSWQEQPSCKRQVQRFDPAHRLDEVFTFDLALSSLWLPDSLLCLAVWP